MLNKFKALITEEQGQGLTEYGLVLGVIAVAVIGTIITFRTEIQGIWTEALGTIQTTGGNTGDGN